MKKQHIRLTESQLTSLINKTIKNVLKEEWQNGVETHSNGAPKSWIDNVPENEKDEYRDMISPQFTRQEDITRGNINSLMMDQNFVEKARDAMEKINNAFLVEYDYDWDWDENLTDEQQEALEAAMNVLNKIHLPKTVNMWNLHNIQNLHERKGK